MPRSQVQQEPGDMGSAEGGTACSRGSVQNATQQAEGWERRDQGSVGGQRLQRWTDPRFLTTEERHRQQRQTRTGPQSDESWAIREALRQRLAEQRQRERDAAREQRMLEQQEETRRRQQDLADYTSQRRERARSERQELDLSTSR